MDSIPPGKRYEKLKVYHEAHGLTKAVYQITNKFPKEERFGLTSQMRRCAVSVPANIVEGHVRGSKKDFRRFLFIANGSLAELEYYLTLAVELKYLTKKDYNELEEKRSLTGKLLGGLIKSLSQ